MALLTGYLVSVGPGSPLHALDLASLPSAPRSLEWTIAW